MSIYQALIKGILGYIVPLLSRAMSRNLLLLWIMARYLSAGVNASTRRRNLFPTTNPTPNLCSVLRPL